MAQKLCSANAVKPWLIMALVMLIISTMMPFSCSGQRQAANLCDEGHTLQQSKDQQLCFWQLGNPTDIALVPQLQQCLQNKRIYIIGMSVSRNWYFVLQQLMAANATTQWARDPGSKDYRHKQKAACGGGKEAAKESCRGTNIVFRWQNHNIYDEDLAAAVRAGKYDIIVANVGLGNLVHHSREWAGRLLQQGHQLAAFASTLPSATRFYYRTTTPICQHGKCVPGRGFQGCGVPQDTNSKIVIGNMVLQQLLLHQDPRVQVLDVMPLTDCSLYEDHVHHPHLTLDHVLLFITRECPHLMRDVLNACPHICRAVATNMDPFGQPAGTDHDSILR